MKAKTKSINKVKKEMESLVYDKEMKSSLEEKLYFSLMDAINAINFTNGIIDYKEYISGVEDYTEPLVPEYEVLDDKEKPLGK